MPSGTEDRAMCARIGVGRRRADRRRRRVVLTHCNAGALATGGIGTALAPVYTLHQARAPGVGGGRRDPAAAAGQPAHRLGAEPRGRAGDRHRRRHGGEPAPPGRRRLRHRRRRPDRGQRRRGQQDRHLRRGARGPGARRAVLRRRAELHLRSRRRPTAPASRSRSAPPEEVSCAGAASAAGARGRPGLEPGVRRDARRSWSRPSSPIAASFAPRDIAAACSC